MALICCPECNKNVSDKAEVCPNCGLPSSYFQNKLEAIQKDELDEKKVEIDYKNLGNILTAFDKDYNTLFSVDKYISTNETIFFKDTYKEYYAVLSNKLIMNYIGNNSSNFRTDISTANSFLIKFAKIDNSILVHNEKFIYKKLNENKKYFDNMMIDIDKNIVLDDEQRRAVVTDDNYCLLVAGAGAGKTTTMAAKVKYLVDKQGVSPDDIIVISYTNKAINELKDRINKGLNIPTKIATFHSFAFDIIRKFSSEPPEVNFTSYKIVFEMLENAIYDNKQLMRNLVLFMGYYFDLTEDVFKFNNLNEYHLFKASQDYETIKSNLGEYVKRVENQRSRQVKTVTGEFLRSIQEVQIANFLYLNGIDYEYEKIYPHAINSAKKKYTPDFFISQGEHTAYIEHYGLTQSLKNDLFTPAQLARYKKSISDKRQLHKNFNTELIETWSYYNDKKPLLLHLKEELIKSGFILKQKNLTEVYKKIVETSKDKYIVKFILFVLNFIEQFKTTGYYEGGFDILRKKTDNPRTLLFLDIAEQVYNYYQEKLKNSNQIDYADIATFT